MVYVGKFRGRSGILQVESVLFPLLGGDELPTFPYYIFPSMILALFVQCHTRDRISKHSHSIVSCVSKHNRSIMSCCKSWDHTGTGSDGEENGDWAQPLGLQTTVITSMAWVTSQMLLLFPLTTLN